MAANKKLTIPQLPAIRANHVETANAIEQIVNYINKNTTPSTGNKITPANQQ